MCEEVKIQITDEIEKIMCQNLSEKAEAHTVKFESCEDCWYYDKPWIRGDRLHCCAYEFEDVKTSREINDLYDNCPINHEVETHTKYIKKYGIIHSKPRGRYRSKGSIAVVDFSGTTFEWDGNNPDVDWTDVVVFYYSNQEEADVMMELALDYYNRFNLDSGYVKKHCYG